jgi:hypothetical protein
MKAFVYTVLQISTPFALAPWQEINKALDRQPGLENKTWLAGVGGNSIGGFYQFNAVDHAQQFVTKYFPSEAARFGVAQTSRIFDGSVVADASIEMNSVHFGGKLAQKPQAFVYTEVQISVPFQQAPWKRINATLKQQPGILSKTWLSGINTQTPGGLYAFDTMDNALKFTTLYFPTEAAGLNAAFTTRVFDAAVVEEASRQLRSPFFVS